MQKNIFLKPKKHGPGSLVFLGQTSERDFSAFKQLKALLHLSRSHGNQPFDI